MKTKGLWTVLLVTGILALPMALTAQVAVNVSAGPTFTTFTGDNVEDEDFDTKTGFFFGGSVGFPLADIVSFGTGAYYVQKGADATEEAEEGSFELDYLEIPAVLQVQVTGPERPVGISLMAGPSFGFKLSCEVSEAEGSVSEDCDEFVDVKGFDLGLLFGAGFSFATSETMSFFVDGGLDLGLTSIVDEVIDDPDDDDIDVKNQAWFLGVGLSWLVGG